MSHCECVCPLDTLYEAQVRATADLARAALRRHKSDDMKCAVFDIDETLVRTHCMRCLAPLARVRALELVVALFRECCGSTNVDVHVITSRYERPGARKATVRHVYKHCRVEIRGDHVHMRRAQDERRSAIVKAELRDATLPYPILFCVGDQLGDVDVEKPYFLLPNAAYEAK